MTDFKRLENPNVSPDDPVKAHYLDGAGVGSPTGPMFKIDIMCLCHEDFAPGESIMREIALAVTRIMEAHMSMPGDMIDDISCKPLDDQSKPH